MEYDLGTDREKYVIVAATMPGPKHFSARPYQEQTYLKPLAWTRRHLNIDDGRMYVTGYSQGGHISWHLAVMFPRHFAAAVPMAGIPFFEGGLMTMTLYLKNTANLPIWAIWGEKDGAKPPALGNVDCCRLAAKEYKRLGNTKFKGTELAGKGHSGCVPPAGQFIAYLAANKRIAMPDKFSHHFHLAHHTRGYYLEAVDLAHEPIDFNKPVEVKVPEGEKLSQEKGLKLLHRYVRKAMFSFHADLNRGTNTLTVGAYAIRKLRLYVLEGMFDSSKPVKVRYWSRSWRGKVPVSARCMLLNYAAARDQSAVVVNEIDLDIRGPATVRYGQTATESPQSKLNKNI